MKRNNKFFTVLYLAISVVTMSLFTGCSSNGIIESNSIVLSKAVDASGNPVDIIENISTEDSVPTVDKDNEEMYVSVRGKKNCRIRVVFNEGNNQENKIANTEITTNESGYANYYIANLQSLKSSKYTFAFANSEGVTEARCSFNLK